MLPGGALLICDGSSLTYARCYPQTVLATDPWLTGLAFTKGWWLQHEPPLDAIECLAHATAFYTSYMPPCFISRTSCTFERINSNPPSELCPVFLVLCVCSAECRVRTPIA